MSCYEIEISNRQSSVFFSASHLKLAIDRTLKLEHVSRAVIGLTIVDDEAIRVLNRQHLGHDFATDVISFPLEHQPGDIEDPAPSLRAAGALIEGDIVVSAETAAAGAALHRWPIESELTLYVIHGLLHVCGYDDLTPSELAVMRLREQAAFDVLNMGPIPRDEPVEE
jgi:probable rRNA maturation factor